MWVLVVTAWILLILVVRYWLRSMTPGAIDEPGTPFHQDYLMHPNWRHRCQCRRYGIPNRVDYIRDGWGYHGERLCQPEAEALIRCGRPWEPNFSPRASTAALSWTW